jgi:hypothetical protein
VTKESAAANTQDSNQKGEGPQDGRSAYCKAQRGNRTAEALVQEVLCKKLDKNLVPVDKSEKARERLLKLFDSSLPDDAIEAIEDLLR